MVIPTTGWPCSTSSAAAVALSTPPDSAATTRGAVSGASAGGMDVGDMIYDCVAAVAAEQARPTSRPAAANSVDSIVMSSAQATRCELRATALDDNGAGVGVADTTKVHVVDL